MLLGQIRDLCIGCGLPVTNLRLQEGTTTLPNGERKAFAQYNFTCSDPGSNRRIGSRTPAYIARMEAGQPFRRKARAYPWHGGKKFSESGLGLARISSIDTGPTEPVYDLTVDGTHSFVAEGVIVHNSNIEEQQLEFYEGLLPWFARFVQEFHYKLFSDAERDEYLVDYMVEGLLKGNLAQRYQAYSTALQWGFMNRNEVRRKENMNSMGEDGDIFLVPVNMQPADKLEEPPPEPTPPAPTAATPAPPDPAASDDPKDDPPAEPPPAARSAILAAAELMIHKETADVRQAAKESKNFLAWLDRYYGETCQRKLRAGLAAAAILGRVNTAAAIDAHSRTAKAALLEIAGCKPDEFAAKIEAETERWRQMLPEQLTNTILGE
jgi:hypothetical protein